MLRILLIAAVSLLALAALGQVRAADEPTDQQMADILGRIAGSEDEVRRHAIEDVSSFGKAAVPFLLKAVTGVDSSKRRAAAQVLPGMKPEREFVVRALINALDNPDKEIRGTAAETLGAIGPEAFAAVPKLIGKFEDPYLRRQAPQAVAKIGVASLTALLAAIQSPNHLTRRGALEALSQMIPDPAIRTTEELGRRLIGLQPTGGGQETIPLDGGLIDSLIAALKDPEDDIRRAATTVLGHLEDRAPAAIPPLLGLLGDPDKGVRAGAENALGRLRPLPCKAFLDALGDPDMHQSASTLLGECRPLDKSVVPRLLEILESSDADLSLWSSHVFEYLRSDAIPDLVRALDSPSTTVRRGVARGLFLVQPTTDQVVPALAKALADADEVVRKNALGSLAFIIAKNQLGSPAKYDESLKTATAQIAALLADKSPGVRAGAADVLAAIGPRAMAATPALERALRDPETDVRRSAVRALGAIKDSHAIRPLVLALRDTKIAQNAASALGEMGSAAEAALPDLSAAHKNDSLRRVVEVATKSISEGLENDLKGMTDEELKQAAKDLANARQVLLSDEVAVDTFDAIKRSEAALTKELAARSPITHYIFDAFWAVLSFLFLYGIALPVLILLYPTTKWARTAVNSGFFRFPLLHRTIIGTNWARRRIFQQAALLASRDMPVRVYIPQSAYPVAAHDRAITFGDVGDALPQLFADRRHVLVRGRSGTGKSVLLRKIAHDAAELFLARRLDFLPLLVDFRTSPISGRSLRDLIRDRLKRAEVKLPNATLDHLIDEGGFLILADSLNEAAGDELKKQLNIFLDQDAANQIVLASQNDLLERTDVALFQIDAVTSAQAREYLRDRTGADIWDRLPSEAHRLATSPQDLAVLAEVVDKAAPGRVPTRRAALYRRLLEQDSVFKDWLEINSGKIRSVFGLAFQLLGREPPVVPAGELGAAVRQELIAQDGPTDDATVKEVVEAVNRSALFKLEVSASASNEQLFTFRHELVGRYLAAQHVLRQLAAADANEKIEAVASLAFDPRWQEVFTFVIEELDDQDKLNALLAKLIDRRRKRSRATAHAIVATALATKPALVSGEIRDRFADSKIDEERLDNPAEEIPEREDSREGAVPA